MAALLLSAAGVLDESGADPAGHGDWRWCDVCRAWAPGDWQEHVEGGLHQESLRLIERYGRCEPRGSSAPEHTIATVVKAPNGDGLVATSAETDEAQRGVRQISKPHSCLLLRKTLIEELLRACNDSKLEGLFIATIACDCGCWASACGIILHLCPPIHALLMQVFAVSLLQLNAESSLPTLERGQAIRGHYRAGDELVIHARPCLVLLHMSLRALPDVPHLRILADPHRILHIDTLFTSAAVALVGRFLPSLPQRRLTFQWDVWSGRPLTSLAAVEQAACHFLQSAATFLASNEAYPLREIVFEINPHNVPEPRMLRKARSDFNALVAAAANPCRQALRMGLHPRSAAAGCLLDRLPAELLHVIMTEAIPVVSCTCTSAAIPSPPADRDLLVREGVEQLAAQIHAHDELQAQRVAAAAAARRRRSRIRKALVVMGGALTGASLLLAAACSDDTAKQQRPEASVAALRLPAAGRQAAEWCSVLGAIMRRALAAARRLK